MRPDATSTPPLANGAFDHPPPARARGQPQPHSPSGPTSIARSAPARRRSPRRGPAGAALLAGRQAAVAGTGRAARPGLAAGGRGGAGSRGLGVCAHGLQRTAHGLPARRPARQPARTLAAPRAGQMGGIAPSPLEAAAAQHVVQRHVAAPRAAYRRQRVQAAQGLFDGLQFDLARQIGLVQHQLVGEGDLLGGFLAVAQARHQVARPHL